MAWTNGTDWRLIGWQSVALVNLQPATGGIGPSLVSITNIVPDSCEVVLDIPGKTELFCEDSDIPDITLDTPSPKTIRFSTRDMCATYFMLAMGGTITTTLWEAPVSGAVSVEKGVRLISRAYNNAKFRVDIPHARVRGGANLRFSKTNSGTVDFEIDILRPAMLGTDVPISVARISA